MSLLIVSWLVLSFSIASLQLIALSQPEWIVHGYNIQGLFVLCTTWECVLRPTSSLLPFVFHAIGSFLFLFSAFALVPTICCTSKAKPVQWIANTQILAASLTAICLFSVPFDMADVDCTVTQLLRSASCRVGWALAVSAVCCLLSICCPVLGKLAADQRKQYSRLSSHEQYI